MSVGGRLRVLQWLWKLSPSESQAAEYAATMGHEALWRQWSGSRRARQHVKKALRVSRRERHEVTR